MKVAASPQALPWSDRYLWLALSLAYVGLYGAMLLYARGMPYVMDNNESFSSLLHAQNLYEHGIAKSYGLADEAIGPPEAHPYVHTHQGNFPRLFAFLIYVLGARTVEAQIAVTTFTVGAGAMALVYLFFSRIATTAFAALVCAVFMTDYVLFAQWHVVTYRVWHCFLLFWALYSVERAAARDGWIWMLSAATAFACLFYFELVFAAFVAALCGLFALFRAARHPRTVMAVWSSLMLGAVFGLCVVVLQLVGYLGFDDFRKDIYLTFLARNDFASDPSLIKQVVEFYESRKVIFWHNIQDRSQFAGFMPFVRSFTHFDWRIHTPLMAFAAWAIWLGWATGLYTARLPERSRRRISYWFIGLALFLAILPIQRSLFGTSFSVLWSAVLGDFHPNAIQRLCVVAAILVGGYLVRRGSLDVVGTAGKGLAGVLLFLLAGLFAYAIVYSLSPGYVYSGYLMRHAPLTVFLTDVVVATALFAGCKTAASAIAAALQEDDQPKLKSYLTYSFAAVSTMLIVFLAGYWLLVQARYVAWLPPDHYAFLRKLSEPPYRGASFVVNTYAAPVAAYTGQWAYLDPVFSHAYVEPKGNTFHIAADRSYLWFADRDTNTKYLRPEYFICMIQQAPSMVVDRLRRERGRAVGGLGCSGFGILRLARQDAASQMGLKLVEYDEAGLETIGFDSWAIVKLETDIAPRRLMLDWNLEVARRAELLR